MAVDIGKDLERTVKKLGTVKLDKASLEGELKNIMSEVTKLAESLGFEDVSDVKGAIKKTRRLIKKKKERFDAIISELEENYGLSFKNIREN